MRITEIDLELEDIEWYGIDENGRIAQFTSGGSKIVPEFICESREKLDVVCEFFENFSPRIVEEVIFEVPKYPRKEYLQECKKISQKGLYCFDISNEQDSTDGYILICTPSYELQISELPEIIQSILSSYRIPNVNFNNCKIISIEKAY
ncbi:hypothetical protein QA584_22075 [Anaerocolumna sp. AGMB13025]|uniref:hypothetical protein n=1 Tax=Anaerocolumna sp. AGMB13025 TaxID=3039116 RepID=UPI00241E2A92|nr:hypothetical protein [Anaerocolumna sp. AGMB13025]WFR56278.1 hypothetical protein QA584_22075 [Anaerocolumna sp. AGMB13025]